MSVSVGDSRVLGMASLLGVWVGVRGKWVDGRLGYCGDGVWDWGWWEMGDVL